MCSCLSFPVVEGNPAHPCMVLTNTANHHWNEPPALLFPIHPAYDLLFTSHGYSCLSQRNQSHSPMYGSSKTGNLSTRPATTCANAVPMGLLSFRGKRPSALYSRNYPNTECHTSFKEIEERSTPASLLTWRGINDGFAMRWRPQTSKESSSQPTTYAVLD